VICALLSTAEDTSGSTESGRKPRCGCGGASGPAFSDVQLATAAADGGAGLLLRPAGRAPLGALGSWAATRVQTARLEPFLTPRLGPRRES
jgi:hypothetical protein